MTLTTSLHPKVKVQQVTGGHGRPEDSFEEKKMNNAKRCVWFIQNLKEEKECQNVVN